MHLIKKISLILIISISATVFSQTNKYTISGVVFDQKEKFTLESATVYMQGFKDSSVVSYTTTNAKGDFTLTGNSKEEAINVFVSFIGYKDFSTTINSSQKTITLDSIFLKPLDNLLDEVVLQSRAPITVKKDTLEFNPNSFKTKRDATVEDFLKKLPGVEVDDNGQITINGVGVDKILVNGKPFFGNDPKAALENLTKDIIDKIQFTDTKTKDEAFTGEVGAKTNKTINITIKKEHNRGIFGRVSAGKGTQGRHNASTSINFFDNDKTMNVYAGGNNSNQKAQSNGLKNNSSGGYARTNFSTKIGGKYDFNSSYSYNTSASERGSIVDRENILPDYQYFSTIVSGSKNENDRHRFNFNSDINIGKNLLLTIRPSFDFNDSSNASTRDEESKNDKNELINSSNSLNSSINQTKNFRTRLSLTQKLGDKGSFLKFRFSSTVNMRNGDNFTQSRTEIFSTNPSILERNQFSNTKNESSDINTNFTYRLPLLANKLFLNFGVNFSNNKDENTRSTFDFDTVSQEYNQFNTDLSNDSNSYYTNSAGNVYVTYRSEKWYSNFGMDYVTSSQENIDDLRPVLNLKKNFNAINFSSKIRYNPSKKNHITVNYNLRNGNPSLSQLNPFKDISNPLNIVTGNPNLGSSKNHSFGINYNSYNTQKQSSFYGNANVNIEDNKVVSKTTILDDFVRYTTYTNVNGNFRVNVYGGYSRTFKFYTATSIRLNLGASANLNNAINFSNDILYTSKNTTFSPNIRLNFNWKDIIEISPRYRVSMNKTVFDINKFKDKEYTNHSLQIRTRTNFPKKLEWENTLNYQYNSAITDGFPKSTWTWDATISYTVFKDQGLISLKANDILNQNNNINRTATENYIQYTQNSANRQNIMLSFRWKFTTKKKAKS